MKSRKGCALAAVLAASAALMAACQSNRPCPEPYTSRGSARHWPDFSSSERFATLVLAGNAESLERTLSGVVHTTYCEFQNFPAALERFWYLIR